jgi:hypothetical protein
MPEAPRRLASYRREAEAPHPRCYRSSRWLWLASRDRLRFRCDRAAPRGLLAVDWLPELGTSLGVARYARYQPWPFGLTPLWSGFSCAPTSPRLVFIVRSLIML